MGNEMEEREVESFANDVMRIFLGRGHPESEILREQYLKAQKDITVTGAGFFVDFEVPDHIKGVPGSPDFRIGNLEENMNGLEHGMLLILFIRNGTLSLLEGATYEETLPKDLANVSFSDTGGDEEW
jgi:hypothetical protein